MDPEYFVQEVAGCGVFQILVAITVSAVEMGCVWSIIFMSFGNYNPGWSCHRRVEGNLSQPEAGYPDPNSTLQSALIYPYNTSLHSNLTNSTFESIEGSCEVYSSCINLTFDPEVSTIVTEWGLICDRNWISSVIISVQMAGLAAGSFCGGSIADRFGRKVSFFLWNSVQLVCNAIAALFAQNWQVFAALRFFMGICAGGMACTKPVHLLEYTPRKWRVLAMSFPSYNIVSAIYCLLLYLLRDWRKLHIATAIMCGMNLLMTLWLSESLRWLAVHGKRKKLQKVVGRVCEYNKLTFPQGKELNFCRSEGTTSEKRSNPLLLLKRPVFQRTVMLSLALFCVSVVYYAIAFGIKNLYGNFYLNFLAFAVVTIPFSPLTPILGNYAGRRLGCWILLVICALLSFSVVIIFFMTGGETRGITITILALVTSAGLDQVWCIIIAYAGELIPTSLRASGIAVTKCATRFGGIIAPYLIPEDFSKLYVGYIISGILCVAAFLVMIGLPETKDMVMADTVQQIVKMTEKDVNDNGRDKSERQDSASEKDYEPLTVVRS